MLRDRRCSSYPHGTLLRLDPRTIAETGRVKLGGPVVSTPVVVGDVAVVDCRDYLLYGVRLAGLSVVWKDSLWFSWVESTPSVADGVIYVGSSDFRRVSAIDPGRGPDAVGGGRARPHVEHARRHGVHGLRWHSRASPRLAQA
jgi:outer membrane protein assembly factor BamB